MLPLEGMTAWVFGNGETMPGDRDWSWLHPKYLTIGVNAAYIRHGLEDEDVSFWIDPPLASAHKEHYQDRFCVTDVGFPPGYETKGVACLRVLGRREYPKWLHPGVLVHRANTGVMAAAWAMSIGCNFVVMVGCSCNNDGRREAQMTAMRAALDELTTVFQRHTVMVVRTVKDLILAKRMTLCNSAPNPPHGNESIGDRLREFYVQEVR